MLNRMVLWALIVYLPGALAFAQDSEKSGAEAKDASADGGNVAASAAATEGGGASDSAAPKPDLDNDGIIDAYDQCPTEPEDFDGFQDSDGCPDPDNDQDGVPDATDPCPNEPGEDCKKPAPLVIKGAIAFAPGSAKIIVAKSKKALDQVLKALQDGQAQKLEIQGHTDTGGQPEKNLELSQKRAEAVMQYLVNKGIEPERLVAKGYGDQKPLKPNTTPRNRAENRRVQFVPIP
jgi:OmpA-OmpF porin, OOP family